MLLAFVLSVLALAAVAVVLRPFGLGREPPESDEEIFDLFD